MAETRYDACIDSSDGFKRGSSLLEIQKHHFQVCIRTIDSNYPYESIFDSIFKLVKIKSMGGK